MDKPTSGIQDTGVVTEVLGTFRGSLAEFLRKLVPTPNSVNIFSGMKVESTDLRSMESLNEQKTKA